MESLFQRRSFSTLLLISLCFIFVFWPVIYTESTKDVKQRNSNDFNVSVKVINGKINLMWNISTLWKNTTVYFMSNLYNETTNTSHNVRVEVCYAFKLERKIQEWKFEAIEGNLLEFCSKSRHCNVVPTMKSLVNVKKNGGGELLCELFTKCTNFEDVFSIHVVSFGGGKEYSFRRENMTISSENIPPVGSFYEDDRFPWGNVNKPINFNVIYFDPSELCGFGADPRDNLQFVIKHYKLNDTNCFYMGQEIVPYKGNTTELFFKDISLQRTDVMYFYYTVKFLVNNKTSFPWQRYTIQDEGDKTCDLVGGVLKISWRPQWNCFGENDVIDQARFCFDYDEACYPVCEASFFTNGTLRNTRIYENNVVDACVEKQHDYECDRNVEKKSQIYRNHSSISWSPESKRLSCELYMTCTGYLDTFSVRAFSFSHDRSVELNDAYLCLPNSESYLTRNRAGIPKDVSAIDVKKTEVTITWKSSRCEIDYLDVSPWVRINKEEFHKPTLVRSDGLYYIYKFTKKGLSPYQEVEYQAYAKSLFYTSKYSPLKRVRTKPSIPDGIPTMNNVQPEGRRIKLTWTLPGDSYLKGLPNETRIIGSDEKDVVLYEGKVDGVKRTSVLLDVNATQRCAHYKVKFCNAPHLCSKWSTPLQMITCKEVPSQQPNDPESGSSSSSSNVTIIATFAVVVVVMIIVLIIACSCVRKRRQELRPKLPTLTVDKDQTGDYIPVGQLSQPGEYEALSTLDKEDRLDELIT